MAAKKVLSRRTSPWRRLAEIQISLIAASSPTFSAVRDVTCAHSRIQGRAVFAHFTCPLRGLPWPRFRALPLSSPFLGQRASVLDFLVATQCVNFHVFWVGLLSGFLCRFLLAVDYGRWFVDYEL